jgi:hypothetical protein
VGKGNGISTKEREMKSAQELIGDMTSEFKQELIEQGWTEDEIERARLGLPVELTPELAGKIRRLIEGVSANSGVSVEKLVANLNVDYPENKAVVAKVFGDTGTAQ